MRPGETAPIMDCWSGKLALWSASPLAFAAIALGTALISPDLAPFAAVAAALATVVVLVVRLIGSLTDLVKGRWRSAVSSFSGITFSSLALCAIIFTTYLLKKADYRARLPDFERVVEQQRAKTGARSPIRMVVDEKDDSIGVGSNSFEQFIYDETDEIDNNPDALKGYWPFPRSPTGVTDVEYGRKSVERINGHYYHVWIADP